jgi:hypothetical protein
VGAEVLFNEGQQAVEVDLRAGQALFLRFRIQTLV